MSTDSKDLCVDGKCGQCAACLYYRQFENACNDGDCGGCAVCTHLPTEACPDPACALCAYRDCPWKCIEHYDKDGCPQCFAS